MPRRTSPTLLSAAAHGYPITYEAGGRQFLAVPASLGGAFRSLTAQLSPEIYQPEVGPGDVASGLPGDMPSDSLPELGGVKN